MKIVIASDHGGYSLKKEIIKLLCANNCSVIDLGCNSSDSTDYPDYAKQVALQVSQNKAERGILFCGTGVGMAITANKFNGVRAAAITDLYSAKMSREHNDLNVLCLGGRVMEVPLAWEITRIFLETPFAGGRHERRVDKIKEIENKNC